MWRITLKNHRQTGRLKNRPVFFWGHAGGNLEFGYWNLGFWIWDLKCFGNDGAAILRGRAERRPGACPAYRYSTTRDPRVTRAAAFTFGRACAGRCRPVGRLIPWPPDQKMRARATGRLREQGSAAEWNSCSQNQFHLRN